MTKRLHNLIGKTFLVSSLFLSALTVQAATVSTFPYTETSFKSSGWTCNKGWTITSTSTVEASVASGISNAWLFSPGLELSSDFKYTFSFKVEATRSNYPVSTVDFYVLPSASSSATPLAQFDRVTTSASELAVECSMQYVPEQTGTVYFTIVDMTDGSKGWKTMVSNFTITAEPNECKPRAVSNLSYTTAGDEGTEVTLAWTNPATDTYGNDVAISKIIVDRDGSATEITDAAMLVPGSDVTWTDPVPGHGIMTYSVTVVDAEGKESATPSVTTAYVGPFSGIDVPCEYSFKDNPYNDLWSLTTAGESMPWVIDTDKDELSVSVSNLMPIDATATSPAFNLSAGKLYCLSYKYTTYLKANVINYGLTLGADGMELVEMHPAAPAIDKTPELISIRFTPAETGSYPLVFHALAEKMEKDYYKNTLSISDITIEELPVVPMPATDLNATVDTEGRVTLTWNNPTTNESGIPVSDLKATILRGTDEIATIDLDGTQGSYTDTPEVGGYHKYTVIISNEAGASELDPASIIAPYSGSTLEFPFAADFSEKPYQWMGTEYGELANGNIFTVEPGQSAAQVTERTKEFADILVSAPIALQAGHTLKVTTKCNTSSSTQSYRVYVSPTVELAENATPLISETASSYSSTAATKEFFVESEGNYYILIQTVPSTSSYASSTPITFYVKAVSLEEVATIPSAVTDAKAVSNDVNQTIDLSFTLPTTSTLGMALSGTLTAEIYHAGSDEVTATLEGVPGEELKWVHSEPIAESHNSYSIAVSLPGEFGGTSEMLTVKSDWFGTTLDTPYTPDFTLEEDRAFWQCYDNSSSYYKGKTFEWNEEKQCFVIEEHTNHSYEYSSSMDDWMISPSLYFVPGAEYEISFDASSTLGRADRNVQYALWLATSNTPEEFLKGTLVSEAGTRLDKDSSAEPATYSHTFIFEEPISPALSSLAREPEEENENLPQKRFLGMRFGVAGNYNYPYVEVSNVKINSATTTGVESVAVDPAHVIGVSATEVFVSDEETDIAIYTTGGVLVAAGKGRVNTSALPNGVYIVRAAGMCIKVTR